MKKYLITGATGFIGGYLLNSILENGDRAYCIVRSDIAAFKLPNDERVVPVYLDLDNISELHNKLEIGKVDCCIHLAWEGITGDARGDYNIQLDNIRRTLNLCEELEKLNVKRFVGIGSLAQRDTSFYVPLDGSTPNNVANYGIAKTTAQYMSKVVCNRIGIEHVWCTLSNIYGVGDKSNNFINFASKLMLRGGHAAFTPGEQTYDFVYVSDAAMGICCASESGKTNTDYFVGSGKPRKLKDYIVSIRDRIDPNIKLYLGEIPFNGVCLTDDEFDSGKLIQDTGYNPKVEFIEGIDKTIQWLKEEN